MSEVLNLTSRQFPIGLIKKIPNLVELQPKMHTRMMRFIRNQDSSFNVAPIRFIKDLIQYHEPSTVLIDDETNVPGLVETLTIDSGLTVYIDSDRDRCLYRQIPGGEKEKLVGLQ